MNITIKNIKHLELASHETNCFTATIYVDGKRAFGVSNDGNGGSDNYFSVDKKTPHEVFAMCKEINEELSKTPVEGYPTLTNDLEIVVGELIEQWRIDKEIKKALKSVCYLRDGKVWLSKVKPTPENIARMKSHAFWKPEYKILNDLPIEEIRQYF